MANQLISLLTDSAHLSRWILTFCVFFTVLAASAVAFRIFIARTTLPKSLLIFDRIKLPVGLLLLVISAGIALQFAPPGIAQRTILKYTLKIGLVVSGFWILNRLAGLFIRGDLIANSFTSTTRTLLTICSHVILFLIGTLIALDTVGISITPVIASLGIGSLAIALALQDTLSNFFSGIYLLIDKPVRIGDFVQLDANTQGKVIQIGWRSAHLEMNNLNRVIVPNAKLASAQLINFDLPESDMILQVPISVAYDSNLNHVEHVVIETAQQVLRQFSASSTDIAPYVRYQTFGDNGVHCTAFLRVKGYSEQFIVKHEFIKAIHLAFQKNRIVMPYPQQVVHSAEVKSADVKS